MLVLGLLIICSPIRSKTYLEILLNLVEFLLRYIYWVVVSIPVASLQEDLRHELSYISIMPQLFLFNIQTTVQGYTFEYEFVTL